MRLQHREGSRPTAENGKAAGVTWRVFDSITAFPSGFWNDHVAGEDISRRQQYIAILERGLPEDQFLGLAAYHGDDIVGCAYFTLSEEDRAEGLSVPMAGAVRTIRRVFPGFLLRRVAAAGNDNTDGEHWWYDPRSWNWPDFFSALYDQLARHPFGVDRIVFRSYAETNGPISEDIVSLYKARGFRRAKEFPVAHVTLADDVNTPEEYLKSLSQAHRYTLRKALRKKEKYELRYEEIEDFSGIIDEVYALYLATNDKAKEYVSNPEDKRFFEDVCRERTLNPCVYAVRDRDGKIVAFGMSCENSTTLELWVVGMDYSANREMSLIYHVYWLAMVRAVRNGRRHVNLGPTTHFVKRKFGAELHATVAFVRHTSPVANYLVQPAFRRAGWAWRVARRGLRAVFGRFVGARGS